MGLWSVAKQWIMQLNDKDLQQNDISLLWALIYPRDGNACACTWVWVSSILYICVEFMNTSNCAVPYLIKMDFKIPSTANGDYKYASDTSEPSAQIVYVL